MISPLDEQLRREIAHFRLAYSCERCVSFDEATGACSLGYPNHEHRERSLVGRDSLVFCKEFDLA